MGSKRAVGRGLLAAVAAACGCDGVAAQEFNTVFYDVFGGRQVFELRLGATYRTPPSGREGAGFLSVALIAGPTPGTTAIRGAFVDGSTLFAGGGPIPTWTNILTSGSAFSLGGGCRVGNQTLFPFINANRPRVATFDDITAAFAEIPLPILGNDQFDAIDCGVSPDGVIYVTSNRTDSSLEVYRGFGGNVTLLQTLAAGTLETPFGGGMRPNVLIERTNGDAFADIAYMTNDGTTRVTQINTETGAVTFSCPILNSAPPTAFTDPRELEMALNLDEPNNPRLIGDFNNDGVADLVDLTLSSCLTQVTSGPAGSANGGNGYSWNGYAGVTPGEERPTNVLWGDYFYVQPDENFAQDAPFSSPFAGRGGPFDGCPARDGDAGPSFIVSGTGVANTQIQFSTPRRLLPQDSVIFGADFADRFQYFGICRGLF